MNLPFVKMHAQGNDFVVVDGLHHNIPTFNQQDIRNLAERRYGIGCDQLLLLSKDMYCDAHMRIFNTDGSEAMNCGNGLRCAADLLMRKLGCSHLSIALKDRQVSAEYTEFGIRVNMGSGCITDTCKTHKDVNLGNLHRVVFELLGEENFPSDRNIEIISGQVEDHIYIDIIERGVGPTRACGSGACATAVAVWHQERHQRPLTIEMPGGVVRVSCLADNVYLEGTVTTVFSGIYKTKIQTCSEKAID